MLKPRIVGTQQVQHDTEYVYQLKKQVNQIL